MAKVRRSHDQKRREKLAKNRRHSMTHGALAYLGKKYKTDELIPTLMYAEIGISWVSRKSVGGVKCGAGLSMAPRS